MNIWSLKTLSVSFFTALLATIAAKLLQFIGEYLVLGDLFLDYGLMHFFFPGAVVMMVAGILANAIMISRRAMSFDNVLRTYTIIGVTAAFIFLTHSVLIDAPLLTAITDLFGNRQQYLLLSVVLLIPISTVPIVTYIFVTNWAALWLAKVFRLTIA